MPEEGRTLYEVFGGLDMDLDQAALAVQLLGEDPAAVIARIAPGLSAAETVVALRRYVDEKLAAVPTYEKMNAEAMERGRREAEAVERARRKDIQPDRYVVSWQGTLPVDQLIESLAHAQSLGYDRVAIHPEPGDGDEDWSELALTKASVDP